jgi:acetylornithine/succinyldiaminopimelate/putrescine aminotransferase
MKSGYLYLDEAEMLLIKNLLQKNKDEESKNLSLKLESYKNTYWDLKNKKYTDMICAVGQSILGYSNKKLNSLKK